jgi:hypothetical protein
MRLDDQLQRVGRHNRKRMCLQLSNPRNPEHEMLRRLGEPQAASHRDADTTVG